MDHLQNIDTRLGTEFLIDQAVDRIFSTHPLSTVIQWTYMCANNRDREVVTEAFYGPNQKMVALIEARKRTPVEAGIQFWSLYAAFMAPAYSHIATWRKDYVRQILNINAKFQRKDEAIFTAHDVIVGEMKKEFPDGSEALRAAFDKGKLPAAAEVYFAFLSQGQWNFDTTYVIDQERPNRNRYFNVIGICARLLTDFLDARRREGPERDNGASERIIGEALEGNDIETPQLMHWPLLACKVPIRVDTVDINSWNFWSQDEVQTLITYPSETEPVREQIQRMFMYGDINPHIGLDAAMDEIKRQIEGKKWTNRYETIGLLHTTQRPGKDNPWRHQGGQFEVAKMAGENWNLLRTLLSRVPKIGDLPGYGPEKVMPQDATPGETRGEDDMSDVEDLPAELRRQQMQARMDTLLAAVDEETAKRIAETMGVNPNTESAAEQEAIQKAITQDLRRQVLREFEPKEEKTTSPIIWVVGVIAIGFLASTAGVFK